jgi:hypothetical protein
MACKIAIYAPRAPRNFMQRVTAGARAERVCMHTKLYAECVGHDILKKEDISSEEQKKKMEQA